MGKLFLLFIGIPLLELAILVKLGELISFWPTIGIVVITGFLGASLAHSQGWATWMKIQTELQNGRMPADEMINGILILIGGIVLLTPGLLTDVFGFVLVIPLTRDAIKRLVMRKLEQRVSTQTITIEPN